MPGRAGEEGQKGGGKALPSSKIFLAGVSSIPFSTNAHQARVIEHYGHGHIIGCDIPQRTVYKLVSKLSVPGGYSGCHKGKGKRLICSHTARQLPSLAQ